MRARARSASIWLRFANGVRDGLREGGSDSVTVSGSVTGMGFSSTGFSPPQDSLAFSMAEEKKTLIGNPTEDGEKGDGKRAVDD